MLFAAHFWKKFGREEAVLALGFRADYLFDVYPEAWDVGYTAVQEYVKKYEAARRIVLLVHRVVVLISLMSPRVCEFMYRVSGWMI